MSNKTPGAGYLGECGGESIWTGRGTRGRQHQAARHAGGQCAGDGNTVWAGPLENEPPMTNLFMYIDISVYLSVFISVNKPYTIVSVSDRGRE